MAQAFARHTNGNAHIALVGRNRAAAAAILATFPKPTLVGAAHEFVECDISVMQNVTAELRARVPRVNFLVLTPGGIDRKLAVHYYGRWRFIRDLLPAVESAKAAGEDAKVMSVFSAGTGGAIDLDDLGLKKSFTVTKAASSAATYNNIMVNDFAARYPGLSFLHSYPGTVRTGLLKTSCSE
ncbi:hypothetical protein C8R46DRAFT_1165542 [Mycena filopes]|nr:hypothetical protein C8R46DRAFT_1165542 [Mycena filopes]